MLLSERRKTVSPGAGGECVCAPRVGIRRHVSPHGPVVGFEVGMFAGSIGSGTVLGAPDWLSSR